MAETKFDELAMALKIARVKNCLTQRELAEKSGVSETAIISIENQKHKAQAQIIIKLAQYFGVEPSEWLKLID